MPSILRRPSAPLLHLAYALLFLLFFPSCTQLNPLPSWNDTSTKQSLLSFIQRTTTPGSPDFVPPDDRIAVFDNDGTLWCEQPLYFQFLFALDRVKALAPEHPDWNDREPFKSILAGHPEAALAGGDKAILEVIAVTHSGMTTDQFNAIVKDWLLTAKHPRFHRPYTQLAYQPMLELLACLRANGYKTFIVSGGGVEFMRAFAWHTYGIPPEQVVGSAGEVKFEFQNGLPVLLKEPKVEFVDDGPGKPVGINRIMGRKPIMAFGNSDGDLQMLQYTTGMPGPRFALIVHHTDALREYAYDRDSHIGKLDKALDEAQQKHWTIVDMKSDWSDIFPPAP